MTGKQIVFTKPNTAELLEYDVQKPGEYDVSVRMLYTAVSAGTERANIMGEKNVSGVREHCNTKFPRMLGYSGTGIVEKIGSRVTSVKEGYRVIVYFGNHRQYNVINEEKVYPIKYHEVSSQEAALMVIACFPMLGVRRTRLEIGESALIAGLGILGLMAVQICRAAGAVPVIASDPNPRRRELALAMGADYAFDPFEPDFYEKVKEVTNQQGANVVIEVSGVNTAIGQVLDCTAKWGRVSLLGCSRNLDNNVDFYHQVHATGISLIGTNNMSRPELESRPGSWTYQDDCEALLKLVCSGRLDLNSLIGEIHSPADAPEIYSRLVDDYQNFPIGVLFDWSSLEERRSK